MDPRRIITIRYALSPTEITPFNEVFDVSSRQPIGFNGHDGLIFVGNGANPSNQASMQWFLQHVFQAVQDTFGDVYLTIIGANWDTLKTYHPHFAKLLDIRGLQNQVFLQVSIMSHK